MDTLHGVTDQRVTDPRANDKRVTDSGDKVSRVTDSKVNDQRANSSGVTDSRANGSRDKVLKVLPLEGLKSLRAFNVYHTLLLGYKMLPAKIGMTYEDFLMEFDESSDEEKVKVLREATAFVPIEQEELDALTCFCCDRNEIPLSKVNTGKMTPKELIDVVVAVCLEISRIKLYSISEGVKKN